ncbi:MAG: hypothetical protein NTU44_15225 [Bacteroidetes bacterium]|nr:hypothetical protein [Bacteroidota bacterium]
MTSVTKKLARKIKSGIQLLSTPYIKQPIKQVLLAGIILITIVKFSLIGTGFLAFTTDENRYTSSGIALRDLAEKRVDTAIHRLYTTSARPGEAIIKILPNVVQYFTADYFNIYYYESNNSYPLFIFNFIIYCIILIVHFKFSKLVLKDEFLALLSVLLYSCLTNSYLYLRHATPYDDSLLIFYLLMYKTTIYTEENSLSVKKSFFIGIFSFFGYLVYPGYLPLFCAVAVVLFFNNLTKQDLRHKIRHSIFYLLGSLSCLAIFESMSRLGGMSYISDALRLSGTINQGSYEESFSFLIKYLFEVDGVTGIIVILGLVLFCYVLVFQHRSKFKHYSMIYLLGIAFISLYLAYAGMGYFLHKMVYYGRLLHQYIPFICIFSLFSINEFIIKIRRIKLVFLFISFVFILNFGVCFIHYLSFSYPRDIGWKLSKTYNLNDVKNVREFDNCSSSIPLIENFAHSDYNRTNRTFEKIIITNCCWVNGVGDFSKFHPFVPDKNYKLVEAKPHYVNFKAYQFEGFNIIERRNLDKMKLQIKTFCKYDK